MQYNITPEDIERAREVELHKLLGLNNPGRRMAVKCPFHKNGMERNPSMSIYPDNSFYCFTCQAKGANAIDFAMLCGASFPEAVDELRKL